MRFKQFIIESETDPEKIAEMIEKDCQSYLDYVRGASDSTEGWLKRGVMDYPSAPYFKWSTMKNRKPLDTSMGVHHLLDYTLKDQCGELFRSEALFCTASTNTAASYGNVFFVFPIGSWKYCWSPDISDAYSFFDNHKNGNPEGVKQIELAVGREYSPDSYDVNVGTKEWLSMVSEYLEKVKPYKTTGLKDAMDRRLANEIMVKCDSAYYVPYAGKSTMFKTGYNLHMSIASQIMEILGDK